MDKLDILNRDEFVEQLVRLIENISDNKTSTCFAIDGAWGSGKSFVLDMLEEQLSQIHSEETFTEKYFIVRYNCWKYDYYEEPLIAIVSEILRVIDAKTSIIPDNEKKRKAIGVLKSAGEMLLPVANDMIKSRTGIDVQKGFNFLSALWKGEKTGEESYKQNYSYDKYFQLNKVIDKLSESLQKIAKEYTVVIVVDELDRCIPEYAVKVLERLHHLTEEKENIITVLAMDKAKLEKSIKNIFGFEPTDKYLEKFINFEIHLDKGNVSEKITEKYFDYVNLFDRDIIPFDDSIEEYVQVIFKDIDPRTQDRLFSRAILIHKMLYSDKKDYSFMCVELLATVLYYKYGYRSFIGTNGYSVNTFDDVFTPLPRNVKPVFVDFFSKKFKEIKFDVNPSGYSNVPSDYIFPEMLTLSSAVLFTWCWIHSHRGGLMNMKYTKGGVYEPLINNANELKKFVETMRIIK